MVFLAISEDRLYSPLLLSSRVFFQFILVGGADLQCDAQISDDSHGASGGDIPHELNKNLFKSQPGI